MIGQDQTIRKLSCLSELTSIPAASGFSPRTEDPLLAPGDGVAFLPGFGTRCPARPLASKNTREHTNPSVAKMLIIY